MLPSEKIQEITKGIFNRENLDYEGDDVVGVELISISSNIDEIDNFRRDSHFDEQVEGFCKNIGWKLL